MSAATPAQRLARWLLWVAPALWAANYIIARTAIGVVSPHVLAFGRWALVLALLMPWVWPQRRSVALALRTEWPQALLLGALGMWVCGAFVYIGAQATLAVNIGLIYAAAPVGIAVASRWLLQEPASPRQQAAMALSLAGVLVVIAQGRWQTLAQARFAVGDLWIVAAALSWVGYSVLQQRWPSALGPRQRLACMAGGGLVVMLPFMLLELAWQPPPPLGWQALGLIVAAALLPGFGAYLAYALLLRELGATRSSVVLYLAPVYAAIASWVLLGEAPQWYHLLGALMILPGIYLASSAPAASAGAGAAKG